MSRNPMLTQLAPLLQKKIPTSMRMVYARPTCPYGSWCLASLGHQVLGQGHSQKTLCTIRLDVPIPPRVEERSTKAPWCGPGENYAPLMGVRHRYWYLWYLKRKWTLILIIIFLIRFKKCIQVIFTAVADLLVHLSPNLPAVCFMVFDPIFICLKKCFSLPCRYMRHPHNQQRREETPRTHSSVSVQSKQGSPPSPSYSPAHLPKGISILVPKCDFFRQLRMALIY